MGAEFKGKGVNAALGPMMNMGRIAQGGRNWEGFGGDPYLTGEAAYETIKGLQSQGVQATAKHFVGNEQELNRTTSSSNIADRTMHEVYLHPFLKSVQAGVASVMCSYNLINNTWACQNSKTINGLLKHELGFQGYVMSDWDATHSGVGSSLAGLDMDMPGDIGYSGLHNASYFGYNLTAGVLNGSIPESKIEDMATRIVAAWYVVGQDKDYPPISIASFQSFSDPLNEHVDVQDDHKKIVREIGSAGIVLLKNVNNTLPLKSPRSISLIGQDAAPPIDGPNGYSDRGGLDGNLAMGWGSGSCNFPYLVSPLEAIQKHALDNGTRAITYWFDNWSLGGVNSTAQNTEVAIVFVNSDSGEGYITVDTNAGDRNNLTAWFNGDTMITSVLEQNSNVIVVVHSVGPLILEPWITHPNLTAVVWAGIPGQESGNSLVDVLWGRVNPSGRLPYTIAKSATDYSAVLIPENNSVAVPQVDYSEGLYIDYRWFLAQNISPRFPFGFGLSYTTFSYSSLKVTKTVNTIKPYNSTAIGASTSSALHSTVAEVEFYVSNVGAIFGHEVPQLYLSFPASPLEEPPKVLKGFERVGIYPGESTCVKIALSRYDLSSWDPITQSWVVPKGAFEVIIGTNSAITGEKLRASVSFS